MIITASTCRNRRSSSFPNATQPSQTPASRAGSAAPISTRADVVEGDETGDQQRSNLHDQNEGLIDPARDVLRPAAELGPDRRQHARIAAEPAQDAGDETDRRVRDAAAAPDLVQARRRQRIDAVDDEEGAEHDLDDVRLDAGEHDDADRHADQPADDERRDALRLDGVADPARSSRRAGSCRTPPPAWWRAADRARAATARWRPAQRRSPRLRPRMRRGMRRARRSRESRG